MAGTALGDAVKAVCADLRPQLSLDTATKVEQVVTRLAGPLQLAVAGRIKSGKSTVVNALIGRRVSPTDVRECTRLVTRFQYGTVDRVEIVHTDGSRRTVPYDADGLVPADLGSDPETIAYVDAYLTSATLREVTVIDTPGLGSLDRASSRRTEVLLGAGGGAPVSPDEVTPKRGEPGLDAGSRAAIAQAEAVLYILTQAARADDEHALSVFHAYSTPHASSPVNAVAVLSKADQVGDGPDHWSDAVELAAGAAGALRHQVWDVLPLVGLVAEATETGQFTESDADTLRRVAALDPAQRTLLFFSADLFVRPEVPVSVAGRARLLERLDLYGIRRAVDLLDADPAMTTGELRRRLVDASGFPAVRAIVEETFRRRADGIKASVALAALEVTAAQAPARDRTAIRDAVEDLMQAPEAHELRLLEAAGAVMSGTVPLPEHLTAEVSRLVGIADPVARLGLPAGADDDEVRAAALDAAGRWRSFATFGSTPAQSRVAHVVHRSYFLLWRSLGGA
jgi:Dynamin family